jgi:hypothetical protein
MSKTLLRHTLIKKNIFDIFVETLSLCIFTIWKSIVYNLFCRDGIYFDKILVSSTGSLRWLPLPDITLTLTLGRSFSDNFSKYRVASIWNENLSQTFHLWKSIVYNLFCRDGIYFDKILVSEYKIFKRSNKAKLLIALVQ